MILFGTRNVVPPRECQKLWFSIEVCKSRSTALKKLCYSWLESRPHLQGSKLCRPYGKARVSWSEGVQMLAKDLAHWQSHAITRQKRSGRYTYLQRKNVIASMLFVFCLLSLWCVVAWLGPAGEAVLTSVRWLPFCLLTNNSRSCSAFVLLQKWVNSLSNSGRFSCRRRWRPRAHFEARRMTTLVRLDSHLVSLVHIYIYIYIYI